MEANIVGIFFFFFIDRDRIFLWLFMKVPLNDIKIRENYI